MSDGAIVIVEAGGTKSSWACVAGGKVVRFRTAGINASVMPVKRVLAVVCEGSGQIGIPAEEVEQVRFYGAGLASTESILVIGNVLRNVFPSAEVVCGTDLLAAACAAFGHEEGIVAILGTGSNSGLYNGSNIVRNIRPGGFILGDEGSGSALGKAFISDWIKGLLPEAVAKNFDQEYHLTYGEIVEKVYRGDNPAGYLGSFAPFIFSQADNEYVDGLIDRNLRSFVERVLMQYDLKQYEVAIVGSFGSACREILERIAPDYDLKIKAFVPDPMDGLIDNLG